MKQKKGFTVIEIILAIGFLVACFSLFFVQKNDIQKTMRDKQRKMSINALYFQLKDVYFKQNGYYPETISPETLKGVDPEIFTDPNGVLLGEEKSNYRYETSNCQNNQCKNFKLTADLEKEASFVRED